MATSSTSATCSCRFMGGSFSGHYSKDMRTRRRYKRREERARHSSCCPESTMPVLPRRGCQAGAQHAAPLHGWEQRGELACGEVFQGAKAAVEFGGRQAPQAVESAQKIRGRTVALARVAFDTAGNQVAVGMASEAHAWHNVVEALHVSGSAAETIKASAAFAIVNGFAERPGFQEIRGFKGGGGRLFRGPGGAIFARADCADLLGQAHLDEVAGLAAFEQAQSSQLIETADGPAHRSIGKTQDAGYGQNPNIQA